jgi:propionate CoA-transferase
MKVISAAEAAKLVKSGDTLVISGSGGGHAVPETPLAAIEQRFLAEGQPRDLTVCHVVGIGDRKTGSGADHFAHDGLIKRSVTSAIVDSPRLVPMARDNKIESYTIPQGVLSQLMRDIAGGRPGLITKTGLHTFVDPRQRGARQSSTAKEDLIELMTIDGEEWLRYKPLKFNVAFLRGTTADEDGNITMEQEAIFGEPLSMAQATKRSGGIVIVQVKRLARAATLPPKNVKIPGILVDYVVVDPHQKQTFATDYDPTYSGEVRGMAGSVKPIPFGPRKIVARRAAMELTPGAICNLGAGISTGISTIAAEEGILNRMALTNEQGFIGGAPLTGPDSGAAQNYDALIDAPYQFDFYDGGGLDIAFLSFGEVDSAGNVNVSRFADKIIGVGGFINISQNAKKVVFSGTFTAGDLALECVNGSLRIAKEGKHKRFVKDVEQICYNARFAEQEGREALFVTERAVMRPVDGEVEIIEIAPGVDLEKDVLAQMGFRPRVSPQLKRMDRRLFASEPMNLEADLDAKKRAAEGLRAVG